MLTAEPRAYGSNRHAATRVESPARPRLAIEFDVDVCVIGAGLAGLTVAREVARLGWSVIVLEAQSVAWSASGRNAGVVVPGFTASPDALIERVGLEAAKALWARSVAGAEYVRRAARDMPGVELAETGWLHVSTTDGTRAMAHEAALVTGEFGVVVEPWPAERVRETLHSPRYFHGLHYPDGFSLHPLNYALGLAAAAEQAGARIFEDTPVLEIDPAGVRKRIVTAHSRVRATHVVLAGNAHLAGLVPQFARTLVPLTIAGVATAPLGEPLREAFCYPGAVSESSVPGWHHRVIDGDRLLWTGASTAWFGGPKRQGAALLRHVRRTYPSLRGVTAEHAWTGTVGVPVHGMPQIGEISPGLWLLGGFGGHGLNTTAMGGEMLARAIVEGDAAWTMFSPFELVWAGGALGRGVKRVFGWSRRKRDSIEGVLARRRRGPIRGGAETAKTAEVQAVPAAVESAPLPEPEFVQPLPEPVIEPPALEPVIEPPAPEPVIEPPPPQISEGQAGDAVPAIVAEPVPAAEEAAPPPPPKRPKRGPKKKKSAAQKTLKELSEQMSERIETAPLPPVSDKES